MQWDLIFQETDPSSVMEVEDDIASEPDIEESLPLDSVLDDGEQSNNDYLM